MKKVLIIDDDSELCELLTEYLSMEEIEATCCDNGIKGLELAIEGKHELVILDIMLPEMNGLEVLKNIRKKSNIPVIMLTAKGDEVDRVLGLELGADDYLPKPFSPRELIARIKAIFRRVGETEENKKKENNKIVIGDVCLDSNIRKVTVEGAQLILTEVEFSILENLMKSAGTVVERQDLAMMVLGRKLEYDDRSLDVHMSNLRKKLSPNNSKEKIKTIRGVGYIYLKPEE